MNTAPGKVVESISSGQLVMLSNNIPSYTDHYIKTNNHNGNKLNNTMRFILDLNQ